MDARKCEMDARKCEMDTNTKHQASCGVLLLLSHITKTYALSWIPVLPGLCFVFPHALFCFMYLSCVLYTGVEYGTTLVLSVFFLLAGFGPIVHIDMTRK